MLRHGFRRSHTKHLDKIQHFIGLILDERVYTPPQSNLFALPNSSNFNFQASTRSDFKLQRHPPFWTDLDVRLNCATLCDTIRHLGGISWQTRKQLVRTRFVVVHHSRTENTAAPLVRAPARQLSWIAIVVTRSVVEIFSRWTAFYR